MCRRTNLKKEISQTPVFQVISDEFVDLTRIYDGTINQCLIKRSMPQAMNDFSSEVLNKKLSLSISTSVNPDTFDFNLLWPEAADIPGYDQWLQDVNLLVTAFCDLFEIKAAGLRLYTLDKAMCPRFHVDHVPARMICSYGGCGTEWLSEYALDRSKLGKNNGGLADTESGLIRDQKGIHQMPVYGVALMKGENWEGNEGWGLVHRSPAKNAMHPRRLLLTLDML